MNAVYVNGLIICHDGSKEEYSKALIIAHGLERFTNELKGFQDYAIYDLEMQSNDYIGYSIFMRNNDVKIAIRQNDGVISNICDVSKLGASVLKSEIVKREILAKSPSHQNYKGRRFDTAQWIKNRELIKQVEKDYHINAVSKIEYNGLYRPTTISKQEKENIDISNIKPYPVYMNVLCGLPGSDKTMIAEQSAHNCERLGMEYIDSIKIDLNSQTDILSIDRNKYTVLSLGKCKRELGFDSSNIKAEAREMMYAKTERALSLGYSVIVDAANLHHNTRQPFIDMAKEVGVSQINCTAMNIGIEESLRHCKEKGLSFSAEDIAEMAKVFHDEYPKQKDGWSQVIGEDSKIKKKILIQECQKLNIKYPNDNVRKVRDEHLSRDDHEDIEI